MSTYDKASLVLIPSGTKEGVVFSQKPTNGDGDFTFSRSTAATRVNADGLIEKETENLLLQSNTFDTTWLNVGSTLTSGQSGYNGNNAWKVEASSAIQRIEQTISSQGVATYSMYAKAGNVSLLRVQTQTAGTDVFFDLSNGTIPIQEAAAFDATITDVGSGWYRCTMSVNETISNLRFLVQRSAFSVTIGDFLYIQDAQLEQGLVARDYIETTTAAVYGGITDNVPRLDYTDASCPSLLLEPQRTNLIPQSEYFGGSDWDKTSNGTASVPVLTYGVESPQGLNNAYEITFNTGSGTSASDSSILAEAVGGQSVGSYTLSFYAKVSSGTSKIVARSAGGATYTTCNLTDQWQRFEITETLLSAGSIYIDIGLRRGLSNEPLNSSVTCQIFGAQLEASSYATSYIPTYGTSVTFAKDFCYGAGNASTFNSEEGVFYFEGSALANDGTNRYLSIDDGTTSNYIYFRYVSTSNNILFRTTVAGVTINTLSTSLPDTTQNHKFAFKWKSGDYAFWIDGVEVGTDTSSTIFSPNVLSNIEFSFPTDGGGGFASNTRQIMIFNTALTDAELIALTTI